MYLLSAGFFPIYLDLETKNIVPDSSKSLNIYI